MRAINKVKKYFIKILFILSTMLIITGSRVIASETMIEGEIRNILTEVISLMYKVQGDVPIHVTVPLHLSDEASIQGLETIDFYQFETELIEVLTDIIDECFGAGVYQAAAFSIPLKEVIGSGIAMYWYNVKNSEVLTLQVSPVKDAGEGWILDWKIEVGISSYESISLKLFELPFGMEYGTGEEAVREAIKNLPSNCSVNAEATSSENALYTIFLPENEQAAYLQLCLEPLDYLQSIGMYEDKPGLRHPYDRKLARVYYYPQSMESEEVIASLKSVWGDGSYMRSDGRLVWTAERLSEDIIDVSALNESFLAERWSHLWNIYESVYFSYGDDQVPDMIRYTGRAASIISVLQTWIGN